MEYLEDIHDLLIKGYTTKKAIKELGLGLNPFETRDALVEKYGQLYMDHIIHVYVMPKQKKIISHAVSSAMRALANPLSLTTQEDVMETRVQMCIACDDEESGRCSLCSCSIAGITSVRSYKCIALKWPE
jgi:hypothetical protein